MSVSVSVCGQDSLRRSGGDPRGGDAGVRAHYGRDPLLPLRVLLRPAPRLHGVIGYTTNATFFLALSIAYFIVYFLIYCALVSSCRRQVCGWPSAFPSYVCEADLPSDFFPECFSATSPCFIFTVFHFPSGSLIWPSVPQFSLLCTGG